MVSGLVVALGTVSPIGLPGLWRSSRSHAPKISAAAPISRSLARQCEDIEHASRGARGGRRNKREPPPGGVLPGRSPRRLATPRRAGGAPGPLLGPKTPPAPPPAPRHDRDILAAVGPAVADRLADDSAARLEAPQ